jgi:hypothetical protein
MNSSSAVILFEAIHGASDDTTARIELWKNGSYEYLLVDEINVMLSNSARSVEISGLVPETSYLVSWSRRSSVNVATFETFPKSFVNSLTDQRCQ